MADIHFRKVLDPETEVFVNSAGGISITQPDESCPKCGEEGCAVVVMSARRARAVAKALMALADRLIEEAGPDDA